MLHQRPRSRRRKVLDRAAAQALSEALLLNEVRRHAGSLGTGNPAVRVFKMEAQEARSDEIHPSGSAKTGQAVTSEPPNAAAAPLQSPEEQAFDTCQNRPAGSLGHSRELQAPAQAVVPQENEPPSDIPSSSDTSEGGARPVVERVATGAAVEGPSDKSAELARASSLETPSGEAVTAVAALLEACLPPDPAPTFATALEARPHLLYDTNNPTCPGQVRGRPGCPAQMADLMEGGFDLGAVSRDECDWFSLVRRVSIAIAKAAGRQLSSRLPWRGLLPSGGKFPLGQKPSGFCAELAPLSVVATCRSSKGNSG